MKMKKVISLLVSAVMVLGLMVMPVSAENTVWDGSTVDISWYGDGSASSFEISTAAQLAGLSQLAATADFTNKTITLNADIDLGSKEFTPIGANSDAKDFNGNFDGAGHIVKNYSISCTTANGDYGLFGRVTSGSVKNLGVENVTLNVTTASQTNSGALVGYLRNSKSATVQNCYARNVDIVFASGITSTSRIAGLVGNVRGTVTSSYVTDVQYSGSTTSAEITHGIGNITNSNGVLTNCYAGVSNEYSWTKITGAGRNLNASGTWSDVYFDTYENTSGTNMTGQIIGTKTETDVLKTLTGLNIADKFVPITTNDYNYGYPVLAWEYERLTKSMQSAPEGVKASAGAATITVEAIEGCEYSIDGENWQTSNVFDELAKGTYTVYARYKATESSYSSLAVSCVVEVVTGLWDGSADDSWYGDGSVAEFEISTPAQFVSFAAKVAAGTNFSGKTVKLTANLDMQNREIAPVGLAAKPFQGTFDGGNYVISNFTLTSSDANENGLFLRVTNGTVKNLGIENAKLNCTQNSAVGVLAGSVRGGSVDNCYVKNSEIEIADTVTSVARFGGFIGYLRENGSTVGKVSNCYATGLKITGKKLGSGTNAGYAIGVIQNGPSLENVYVANNTNETQSGIMLGLGMKDAKSIVANCYYDEGDIDVSANSSFGEYGEKLSVTGLRNAELGTAFKSKLTYDYNDGYPVLAWEALEKAVQTAPEGVKAEVNEQTVNVGEISGCEYSMDGENWQTSSAFENVLPGTYTVYVRYAATETAYSSWPSSCTVEVKAPVWDGSADDSWYGDGSAAEFEISTPAQFVSFAAKVAEGTNFSGKTVTLAANLDMQNNEIASVGLSTKPFQGTFNGGNHVISNFILTSSDANENGLFARITNGTVKNLGIENAKVNCTQSNAVGVLAGSVRGGSVDNCYVKNSEIEIADTVTHVTRLGGFIGYLRENGSTSGAVSNCYVSGVKITGALMVDSEDGSQTTNAGYAIGVVQNKSKVSNIYAVNNTNETNSGKMLGLGMVDSGSTASNCYYVNCDTDTSYHSDLVAYGEKVSGVELRNADMGSAFLAKKTYDYNNGYPIFAWETLKKPVQAAPESVEAAADGTAIRFTAIENGEYSIDGENWTTETVFEGLDAGLYTVYARYAKTDDAYSSWYTTSTVAVSDDNMSVWNGEYDISWFDGSSTEYTITTADQLASLAYIESDFSGITLTLAKNLHMGYTEFKPIETFGGTLNGSGYTISGLKLSAGEGADGTLIKTLNGNVNNIGFEGVTAVADSANNVSAIAAVNNGNIEYCYVKNFTYSGTAYRVGTLTAYNTGIVNHCYVLNIDISGAYNGSNWKTVCEGIGMGVGRIESGKVSNVYVSGTQVGSPSCRFNFGYTVNGNSSNFENCYSTMYRQGGVLNPNVKVEGNYTYPVGTTVSEEQLTTLKNGWCELDGFAVDYYGVNGGYPIFEKDIPSVTVESETPSSEVMAAIPEGGKIVINGKADLTLDNADNHYIITGGILYGSVNAKSVEVKSGAVVEASINANDVTVMDAQINGTIAGTGVLDMTDYTGYATTINNASGFEAVYGPVNVKMPQASNVYLAQYEEDLLKGVYLADLAADSSLDLSGIETSLANSANAKVLIWNDELEPLTKTYELRDELKYAEPLKVLILGNSITWHSPAPSLNWYGARGMAASSDETDYVHVLGDMLSENHYNVEIKAQNIADLENYWKQGLTYANGYYLYDEFNEWKPDVVIMTIGANMMNQLSSDEKTAATAETFKEPYQNIVSKFANENSKVIACTTVITDSRVMEAVEAVATENGYTYVDGKTGLNTDEYLAKDASDSGVAAHPNDAGMAALAQRIYDAFTAVVEK